MESCWALMQADGLHRQIPVSQRLRRVAVIDMPCMATRSSWRNP